MTVDVDVMVGGEDWEWPPEVEHPDAERITNYGWAEVPPTSVVGTSDLGRETVL